VKFKVGDLVKFKCIGAGKTDNPPYSQDGEWRTGVVLRRKKINFQVVNLLYRGHIIFALERNCRLIGTHEPR
jgi:hypothetical protein